MSLPAWNNNPGHHTHYKYLYAVEQGTYVVDPVIPTYEQRTTQHYVGTVRDAMASREITKGNRKDPTAYGRRVWNVVEDEPFLTRHTLYGGQELVYDYTMQDYISRMHGPFGYNPVKSPLMANAQAEADVRCLNNLAEHKSAILANLAQARQVVDLFSDAASALAKTLLALKRGQFRQVAQSAKQVFTDRGRTVASAHLAAQYGIVPLVGDMHNADIILRSTLEKDTFIRASGKASYETGTQFPYRNEVWDETTEGRVRTVTVARVQNPLDQNMSKLGLNNPAAIAWEVIPWSFIVDWFIPVGNTLEALTATYGLEFVRGWQTRQHDYMLSAKHNIGYAGPSTEVLTPGSYVEKGFAFDREPSSAFPIPRFYADLTPYSTPRALNALALVRQLHK